MTELTRPIIDTADRRRVAENDKLMSFLYDLDLLPEQLDSQQDITVGLIAAYNRLFGIMIAYNFMERLKK